MGDLSKNFSLLEIMCPCSRWANRISPLLVEKLQKVRNIIGRPIVITSGVRCEFFNASINSSMNSSHIPDGYGIGNAVDIACSHSQHRYELVEVAQKFFKRIGKRYRKWCGFIEKVEAPLQPMKRKDRYSEGLLRRTRVVLDHNSWQLEKLLGRPFLWSAFWSASFRFTKKQGILKQPVWSFI